MKYRYAIWNNLSEAISHYKVIFHSPQGEFHWKKIVDSKSKSLVFVVGNFDDRLNLMKHLPRQIWSNATHYDVLTVFTMMWCLPKLSAKRHHFRRKHHWRNQHHLPKANIIEKRPAYASLFSGGDGGDRTHDLLTASQTLSQLSYAPEFEVRSKSE